MTTTLYEHSQAAGLSASMAETGLVGVVRDSFHSLIGDFYIAGIMSGYFTSRIANMPTVPPMFLWDAMIPKPNEHTALAWFLTLEHLDDVESKSDHVWPVVPPESIDPYLWRVQDTGPDSTVRESHNLRELESLTRYIPNDFKAKLTESTRSKLPPMFHPDYDVTPSVKYAIDNRESVTAERLRSLMITRMAVMLDIVTPPRMPMTMASMEHRGLNLRPWARHGLIVRPTTTIHDGKMTAKQHTLKAPIRLSQSLEEPILTHVPHATPPLWMAFTYSNADADSFMHAYFAVRRHVTQQIAHPESHPGVVQPAWHETLSRKGLVLETKEKGDKFVKGGIKFKGFDVAALSDIFSALETKN